MKNRKEEKQRKGSPQEPGSYLKVITSHSQISTQALCILAPTISQLDLGQRANL